MICVPINLGGGGSWDWMIPQYHPMGACTLYNITTLRYQPTHAGGTQGAEVRNFVEERVSGVWKRILWFNKAHGQGPQLEVCLRLQLQYLWNQVQVQVHTTATHAKAAWGQSLLLRMWQEGFKLGCSHKEGPWRTWKKSTLYLYVLWPELPYCWILESSHA